MDKAEDRLFLSQVMDKIEFSKTRNKTEHTDFLDMYQVALAENFLKKIKFDDYMVAMKKQKEKF